MAGHKGTKVLKESEFNKIKKLLAAGVPPKYVKSITGRSEGTVTMIAKSNSLAHYKEIKQAVYDKSKAKRLNPFDEQRAGGVIIHEAKQMILPQHREPVRVKQLSAGHVKDGNEFKERVYGLGEDNKLYYWDVSKGEPEWRLYA